MSSDEIGKVKIKIDPDLADLIPVYLERRASDADEIMTLIKSGDFTRAKTLGHQMKGSGAGYGFDFISEIGAKIETEAAAENSENLASLAKDLKNYLCRVEAVFE